jgi:hypothetical protein
MKPFAFALLICLSGTAFGCTCFEDNKHSVQNLVFSAFVFEGKIIATTIITPKGSDSMIKALFKVENWLSPKSGADTISIYTHEDSCGLSFATGQSWLLFASPFLGRLMSSYCDRSVLMDVEENSRGLLQQFRTLATGVHHVDIELKILSGPYRLIGVLENGEPVGQWLKLRGRDTLAFYNFIDGTQNGLQMETDEETSPPERHYYKLSRKGTDTLTFTLLDSLMRPTVFCEYRDGPIRIRYQAPYWDAVRFDFASNFKHVECRQLGPDQVLKKD